MLAQPLTTHARIRMQQRGIPEAALDVLLGFGREAFGIARTGEIPFRLVSEIEVVSNQRAA